MITHVALYRFPADTPEEHVERFTEALAGATLRSGLSLGFDAGTHVPLPADEPVRPAVYTLAASWDFADLEDLDAFSRHDAMREFASEWVMGQGVELAFVNYRRPEVRDHAVV